MTLSPEKPIQPCEPPGARGARVCGILAVAFAVTCAGLPVALVLGIIALYFRAKARRAVMADPSRFRDVSRNSRGLPVAGAATTVVGLLLAGILAVPAVNLIKARGLDGRCIKGLERTHGELAAIWTQGRKEGLAPEEIRRGMERHLQQASAKSKNPWEKKNRAYLPVLESVAVRREGELEGLVKGRAVSLGEGIFVMTLPEGNRKVGFLAGAVRLKESTEVGISDKVYCKVIVLP